ncbi:MAG: hypothetical protein JWR22_1695 [Herminiimonas sp.]|nr:hypothetical protein [Herminiimonas sp.]
MVKPNPSDKLKRRPIRPAQSTQQELRDPPAGARVLAQSAGGLQFLLVHEQEVREAPGEYKVARKKGSTVFAREDQKLAAAATVFTQAVAFYGERSSDATGGRFGSPPDFQNAYASLIRVMPRKNRLALLRQMRKGLEDAARAELNASPAELAVPEDAGITTSAFMQGLERQEREQRAWDIAEKRLLPGAEMQGLLRVTPQALSAALKARRIFALQGPSGQYAYPAFFADAAYDRPVLESVSKALGALPGASKWDFFTAPRRSLGGKSPLEALAKGKVDAVMEAAIAYREE